MLPIAGTAVDRWNRKLTMIISDVIFRDSDNIRLHSTDLGRLELWHLYVTGAFTGIFQSFQWPAFSASVSLIVPKKNYAKASGMLSLADSVSNICAPAAAGVLIGTIGIVGVMTIDIGTFLVAVAILLTVTIPRPPRMRRRRA